MQKNGETEQIQGSTTEMRASDWTLIPLVLDCNFTYSIHPPAFYLSTTECG